MKHLFLALTLLIFSSIQTKCFSQDNQYNSALVQLNKKGEVYFQFQVETRDDLKKLQHQISIDAFKENTVYAYANQKEFDDFLTFNFSYKVLTHPGDLLTNPRMKSRGSKGIWEFDSYPTYDEYVDMMYQFESNFPDLCEIIEIGTTVEGRKLLFAKISDNVKTNEAEPRFMYTSTMHGDETAGYITMLRLINYLLTNYGSDAQASNLVDNIEIWINPLENPDGAYASGNHTIAGAKRYNGNNVDLNRNYPNPWYGNHPDNSEWQPETVAMMQLADSIHFVMSANSHGGAEVVNYPWDTWSKNDGIHPDDDWWMYISNNFAATSQTNSPAWYMTDVTPDGVTNGGDWYIVAGSRQDYMNYYGHCKEFTLELSTVKLLPADSLPNHWEYNYRSFLNYMEESLYGVNGVITDAKSGEPIKAEVFINNYDGFNSHVYSELPFGDYYRPLYAGTYEIALSAEGYQSKTITVNVSNQSTSIKNVALVPLIPVVDFKANYTTSCTGEIKFSDYSIAFGNHEWAWDFGDGSKSTEQHPTHTYQKSGSYTVKLKVANNAGADLVVKDDYINISRLSGPIVPSVGSCQSGTFVLSVESTGMFNWFNDSVDGSIIHTGKTYTTSFLNQTTDYYVEETIPSAVQSIGEASLSSAGGYFTGDLSHYLVFDCYSPVTLVSVEVNADGEGEKTIELRDSNGIVIESKTVFISSGISRIDLNFDIPIGYNLQLAGPPNPRLWRNNDPYALSYPYKIDGLLNIKHSSATPDTVDYYYFFYNWDVKEPNCISERTKVSAIISDIKTSTSIANVSNGNSNGTATINASGGSGSYYYQWDENTDNQTTQTATNLAAGAYHYTVTDEYDCTTTGSVTIEDVTGVDKISNDFTIYPNPTNGQITIETQTHNASTVEVVNVIGEVILRDDFSNSKLLDLSDFQDGIYLIKVSSGDEVFVKKIVLRK